LKILGKKLTVGQTMTEEEQLTPRTLNIRFFLNGQKKDTQKDKYFKTFVLS
jgi:hypothetical protein